MPTTLPTDRWVLDHLPGAAFVIDDTGLIIAGSQRAAAMVGRTLDEFVGSSILAYVDPDAVWAYAAALNTAIDAAFIDTYGGPVRIAVHDPDGRPVAADLWSSNQIGADGPQGVVLLMTEQTVALGVAEAVGLAAMGTSYADVATAIVGALGGFPVIADGAVFASNDGRITLVASNVPASLVDGTAGDDAWADAIKGGERVLFHSTTDAPPPMRDLLQAAGYHALWVEPIVVGTDEPTGALAAFRRLPGEPTSNELANLHQAASTLALARLTAPHR